MGSWGILWAIFLLIRLLFQKRPYKLGPSRDQDTAQVTAQVLNFCQEPRKSSEIMELIGLKHWKTFQINYLKPLLQQGLVAMIIPEKPTSSKQRYVTTEKGKEALREFGKIEFWGSSKTGGYFRKQDDQISWLVEYHYPNIITRNLVNIYKARTARSNRTAQSLDEKTYVEIPFIEQLKGLGRDHIEGDIDVPYLTERKTLRIEEKQLTVKEGTLFYPAEGR